MKTNKTTFNKKCNNQKMVSTIKTSKENIMDQGNYNLSDSSLELSNMVLKSKKKKVITFDQKKESISNLKDLKSEKIKIINNHSSVINFSSSSNESFKSTKSVLSDSNYINIDNKIHKNCDDSPIGIIFNSNSNYSSDKSFSELGDNKENSIRINIQDAFSNYQNKSITPKKQNIIDNNLSESAKLLDRIYGKEWRNIDGVIKSSTIKNLNVELIENNESEWCNENIENTHNIQPKTKNNYLSKEDFETEVKDTSIILENFSLSNNSDCLILENQLNITSHQINNKISSQLNTNEYNHIKPISKSKILTKNSDITNSDAKLSFLSSLSCFTGSMKCDPEAEKYKLKFKKNKDNLVSVLFDLFNKEVFNYKLPKDMNFKWNARLRSTAGACFNKRSVKINELLECERVSRIELSSKIIDTAERLRDTLIHELCHAACWIFDGISEGHGPSWKKWANKAMQTFPELPIIKRCHSYDIQTKFTYKCIKCGYSFGRHSKSLNLDKKRCGFCFGVFELTVNKMNKPIDTNTFPNVYTDPLKELYKLDDVQQKPKIPKKPSKFALFVKENYSRVKRENPNLKHGEIMKSLGSQYTVTKILSPDEIFDKLLNS